MTFRVRFEGSAHTRVSINIMNPEKTVEITKSEILPCLRRLVEDVDDAVVDAADSNLLQGYNLSSVESYPSRYGCPPHTPFCGITRYTICNE
jgi:hypothetical protein